MYQFKSCRILDGKDINDCGSYARILPNEHNTDKLNTDHANKMDSLKDDGDAQAQAHAQNHVSVTTVTLTDRRTAPLPTGSSVPLSGLNAPLHGPERPGDLKSDVVQLSGSTVRVPHPAKVIPIHVSSISRTVCWQTDQSLADGERNNSRPVFVEKLKSQSVEEGQCARFTCQVRGQPAPSVHWEKDGRQVAEEKFKLTSYGDTFTLEIPQTMVADAGRYVCIAVNEVGEARSLASLMVQKGQGHGSKVGHVDIRSTFQNRTTLRTFNLQSMDHVYRPESRSMSKKQQSEVETKPTAICRQLDYSGKEGATVSMSCQVTGIPEPKVLWFKDVDLVEPSESGKMTCMGGVSSLELNSVKVADSGTYTCQVENELGKASASCTLSVRGASHKAESSSQSIHQDSTSVSSLPRIHELQDHGKHIPIEVTENCLLSSEDKKEEINPKPKVIKMSNELGRCARTSDQEILSPADGVNSAKLSASPKNSLPRPEDSQTRLPSSVEIPSTVLSHSQPEFPGSGKTDSYSVQVGSVTIDDEDDDAFEEPSSPDALYTAADEPPFIEDLQPENIHILCGEEIHLVARFSGHPLPQTKWLRGTELLVKDDRIRFEVKPRFAELTILNAQPEDTGTYTLVIRNEFGEDKQLSSVTVEDKPDPPVGRPAVTSILDNSVVLSWSGSSYDGGCPVIRYRVEMSHHNTDIWEVLTDDCQHTTYLVKNLVANTQYAFRVSAANKHGFSQPGEKSVCIATNGIKVSSSSSFSNAAPAAEDDFPFLPRVVAVEKDKKFTDSYVLGEEIGKGKFGSVYKCTEKNTNHLFAAKFIRVKAGQRDEFRQEIRIMNELHHPKLLLLWDAFESTREIILVMEHVSGGELMERIINDDYILTERECIHFLRQICDGVQYMHSNDILHLDLKPENILCITPNSNEIKIIDFGLARKFDPKKDFKVLFGTAEFVAPEVINYDCISYTTDMWSVGVICYVLLSGLSPFLGNDDKETLVNVTKAQFDFDDEAFDEISDDAKDFISKLLVKDARKRMLAEDSLQHRWMAQDVTYMRAKKLSTAKHKKFMARNKWQKTGRALVALRRMVGLQRMSSGHLDSCRSTFSSSSPGEIPSFLSDTMSTISESDDSGFRSAQTRSVDLKSVLGISKGLEGIGDLKDSETGSQCEQMNDDSVSSCEVTVSCEDNNETSGLPEDCHSVSQSDVVRSDKFQLLDGSSRSEESEDSPGNEETLIISSSKFDSEPPPSELKSSGSSAEKGKEEAPKISSFKFDKKPEPSEEILSETSVEQRNEETPKTSSLKFDRKPVPSEEILSGTSAEQGNEETLTISSLEFETKPSSVPASCNLEENIKGNISEKSSRKSSDHPTNISTKSDDHSNLTKKTSSDQPPDPIRKRELFSRKSPDLPTATKTTESPLKKSLDQKTVSRFSEKSKAAKALPEQPSQTVPSSRNTATTVTHGKLSNKPTDTKTPKKIGETSPISRKTPTSSFVPTTRNSDSLVAARKLAVQQLSAQKSAKPKKAPTFVRKMKNLQVLEGAAAKFDVLVDGNPSPTISWFKDGKEIPPSPEKFQTESSADGRWSLTVMNCGEDDDAEYGCKASNVLGSVLTKANLYVEPIGEELDINNVPSRNETK